MIVLFFSFLECLDTDFDLLLDLDLLGSLDFLESLDFESLDFEGLSLFAGLDFDLVTLP